MVDMWEGIDSTAGLAACGLHMLLMAPAADDYFIHSGKSCMATAARGLNSGPLDSKMAQ
jgi:hypothetical protein